MKKSLSMIKITVISLSATLLLGIAGCSQDSGPDAISPYDGQGGGGTFSNDCIGCHIGSNPLGPNPVATNGSGTEGKHVVHYSQRGFDCDKCHLDYFNTGTHLNGTVDTEDPSVTIVIFDSTNSSGQWTGDTGPGSGSCSSMDCHGTDTLEWYGTTGWTLPVCTVCHASPRGSRRAVTGVSGDFGSNPSVQSHHVAAGGDPADIQCLVCHDLTWHMAGDVHLADADTSAVFIYDPSDPSSAEPFCLSCHDSDGAAGNASPFTDGQTIGVAPYRMSAEIKTHWNKQYGHQTRGLTCFGDGTPDTGCHANGHGSDFVGILSRNLSLPNTNGGPYTAADEGHYELCFNCHANYPRVTKEAILGVMQSGNYDWDHWWWGINPPYYIPNIMTTFRDRNSQGSGKFYDNTSWFGNYFNLHYWHLEDYIWFYRDMYSSGASCTTCHNIHGSNTQRGWLYDEIQMKHYQGFGSDEYAVMEYSDPYTLSYYPTSCSYNCHAIESSYMWYEPPNE